MNRDPKGSLEQLLQTYRAELVLYLHRHAGVALLRFEAAEDLAQGVLVEALEARHRFEERSVPEFRAWLFALAKRYLSNRRDYWFALKRNGRGVLRLTLTGSTGNATPLPIADDRTGPATLALRRDQLVLVTRALSMLLPRDRDLIRWSVDGVSLEAQAQRLGIEQASVERARGRAEERLRKAVTILMRAAARKR